MQVYATKSQAGAGWSLKCGWTFEGRVLMWRLCSCSCLAARMAAALAAAVLRSLAIQAKPWLHWAPTCALCARSGLGGGSWLQI